MGKDEKEIGQALPNQGLWAAFITKNITNTESFNLGIRASMTKKEPQRVSRYMQGLSSPIRKRLELGQVC